MTDAHQDSPDHTAVRTALWRALHVELDPAPHVLADTVGLELADPGADWRQRGDMDPERSARSRATIVGRARFVEDLVEAELAGGVDQAVLLGAGLDSMALRRADLMASLQVYEIDEPATQAWKQARLSALGLDIPSGLHFVPVDFEAGDSWTDQLVAAGFDVARPAVVVSTGVSMYLSHEAIIDLLARIAAFAPGSTLALTFMQPIDRIEESEQVGLRYAEQGARAAGTPWLSFFTPDEMIGLARDAGFADVRHVSAADLTDRYFAARTDDLRPPYNGEEFIVATVAR